MILCSNCHTHLYDLSLCFYDDIKLPQENKVNDGVLIDRLHFLGLLKNHREPFFFDLQRKLCSLFLCLF